jgi:protocatechuate 3,4-dioxygenase beta subunit
VQASGKPILTTQVYFPDEPRNARDGIFHEDLVMKSAASRDGRAGLFNFVLDLE